MTIYRNCRGEFIKAVIKVFKNTESFLDYIDSEEFAASLYDCINSSDGECYIINRTTGEYINWYKYTHIGRDIHSTVDPNNFEDFLQKFYKVGCHDCRS